MASAEALRLWAEIADAIGPAGAVAEIAFGTVFDVEAGTRPFIQVGATMFVMRPATACELADELTAMTSGDGRRNGRLFARWLATGLRRSAAEARAGRLRTRAGQDVYAALMPTAGRA